jgi:hypothetical protein
LEGHGRLQVSVANTRLLGLVEPVAYLLHYPYGCAEQTISNMLPGSSAPQLRAAVPELNVPNDKAAHAINLGSAGFSKCRPTKAASVYGRAIAPQISGPAPTAKSRSPSLIARLVRAGRHNFAAGRLPERRLRNSGDLQDNFELSDHCLALYALALAGRPENSYHEVFFNKRDHLSAESRALLALAILESGGPATMVEELINPHGPMEAQGDVCFGGAERELAVRLLAWSQFRPNDHEVDVLVEELLRAQHAGRWENTQGNAWAMLGLTKYATQSRPAKKAQVVSSITTAIAIPSNSTNGPAPSPRNNPIAKGPLSLGNPQARQLFTQVKLEARPPVGLQPRQDRGFMLQRSYQKMNDDGSLTNLNSLGVGDRVLVTLQLEVRQPAHFVAVDDALPAIFEAINPEFKTQAVRGAIRRAAIGSAIIANCGAIAPFSSAIISRPVPTPSPTSRGCEPRAK